VSPRTAFWIGDILSDADAREFVFGRGGSLELPFPVAVKTGTSQAYHDNWTIGYSRHVTVGVWVGNFDRTPLRNSSGVTGAGPIFNAVMLAAERRRVGAAAYSTEPILPVPSDVVEREVCALSGLTANAWCPVRTREWVAKDAASVPCHWHHHSDEGLRTFWPAEYRQWARDNGLDVESGVRGGCRADRNDNTPMLDKVAARSTRLAGVLQAALTIVSPPNDATYLVDPTLRREFQTLPLRVTAATAGPIEWMVSGKAVGSAHPNAAIEWPLAPGRHRIVARDAQGHVAEVAITVR
jgi:penicillin-binding protein 1C